MKLLGRIWNIWNRQFLGTEWSKNAQVIEIKGVNHVEMGTHPKVQKELYNIFDGQYGSLFYIDKR